MADLRYIKENTLNKKLQSASAASCSSGCFLIFSIGSILLGLASKSGLLFLFGLSLFFYFFSKYFFGASNNKEIEVLRSGLEGEIKTQQILSRLSNDFTVFNQFEIPASNEYGAVETDFLVVGSNGVFLVEVKNNKGEIRIDYNENVWNVTKTGRGGTSYTSAPVRNPIKQVKSHIFVLSQIFKANKIRIWIEGCVYFSGECEFTGASQDSDVPLFKEADGLINYITNHRSKLPISKDEIINFLVNLSARKASTPPMPPQELIPKDDFKYNIEINCPTCRGTGKVSYFWYFKEGYGWSLSISDVKNSKYHDQNWEISLERYDSHEHQIMICNHCKGEGYAYAYFDDSNVCSQCSGTKIEKIKVKAKIGVETETIRCRKCQGSGKEKKIHTKTLNTIHSQRKDVRIYHELFGDVTRYEGYDILEALIDTDEKREFYSNYRQRKINGVLASEKKTNFQKRPPSMKMDPSPKCVPEVQTRQKETFSPDCHDSEPDKSADEKINRGEVCRYCGEKTNQSFKYCPKCGKQIKFQNSEQEDSEYLEINMMDLILDKGSLNGRKIKTQAKGYYETGNLTLHTDNFSEYVEVDVKNIPRKEKKDLMTSSSEHARYVVWGKLTTSRYNNGLQIEAQKVVVLCDNDDY